MCDPTTIAESTGIAVIDALPQRDLSVGGTGRPLAALPLWMILADRNPKVADQDCVLVDLTKQTPETFWLPASDGLDAEVPSIKWQIADADLTAGVGESRSSVEAEPKFERLDSVIGKMINLDALVAAILGMFHIDQLPGNLPRLTGATSQRILGRLTPGRPANWRQLIRAMAQYCESSVSLGKTF